MLISEENREKFLKTYKKLTDLEELRRQGLLKIDERDSTETEGKNLLQESLPEDSLVKRKFLKQYSSTQWKDVTYGQFAGTQDKQLEILKNLFEEVLQEEDDPQNTEGQHIRAGEVYEARQTLRDIFSTASKSIWIQDNYLDTEIIPILKPYISVNGDLEIILLTKHENASLISDLVLFNKEYKPISYQKNEKTHDRYIIIDEGKVYSTGGSIKDLGKKACTITKINDDKITKDILSDFKEWKDSSTTLL